MTNHSRDNLMSRWPAKEIAEMEEKENAAKERLQAAFATLLPLVENPPTSNITAVGHLMRAWLQGAIADAGTSVDTGAGMGGYDLWVKVGGEEIFIHLKPSLAESKKLETK